MMSSLGVLGVPWGDEATSTFYCGDCEAVVDWCSTFIGSWLACLGRSRFDRDPAGVRWLGSAGPSFVIGDPLGVDADTWICRG